MSFTFELRNNVTQRELTCQNLWLYRYDSIIYARALGGRPAGTHSLHLIEGADHNFVGVRVFYYEVGMRVLTLLTVLRGSDQYYP